MLSELSIWHHIWVVFEELGLSRVVKGGDATVVTQPDSEARLQLLLLPITEKTLSDVVLVLEELLRGDRVSKVDDLLLDAQVVAKQLHEGVGGVRNVVPRVLLVRQQPVPDVAYLRVVGREQDVFANFSIQMSLDLDVVYHRNGDVALGVSTK